jgi:anti-anti-sigma regulatory factor
MAFSIEEKEGRQTLKIEGEVTIRHARDLAAKLGEVLQDGTPLEVNSAALQDVDTCILQLLCSLSKTAPALSFPNPSEALLAAVDRCGLRRGLPVVREGL